MTTMTMTDSTTHKPRRPATPPHSRWILRRSVRPRSAAAILILAATLPGCHGSPEPVVISEDRTVAAVPCARHASPTIGRCYEVTETWMQERYQVERGLRMRLERYEAHEGQEAGK